MPSASICFFILPTPGSSPITPDMPPIFCHLAELLGEVVEVEDALPHALGGLRRLLGVDDLAAAFSTRPTMSPMPRMRPAMRVGSKSSSPSSRSPVPISLIGLPVTARMDSAAPPRPSPSTRVSTMPVTPTRSSKDLARLTASWPVSASATSRISCGLASRLISAISAISGFVDMGAAGGVEDDDVIAAEPGRGQRAAADLDRHLAGDDRQRVDAGLLAEDAELLLRRRAARVERGHQHLPLVALAEALGDLRGGGGLARALQADQHQRHRRRRVEVDGLRVRAEHLDELVVDDLHHHLAGGDRADDVLRRRPWSAPCR